MWASAASGHRDDFRDMLSHGKLFAIFRRNGLQSDAARLDLCDIVTAKSPSIIYNGGIVHARYSRWVEHHVTSDGKF